MKKTLLVLTVAMMVALPLVFATYASAVGPLKIDQPAEFFKGGKKTKPGVDFSHDAHNTKAAIAGCKDCHHKEDEAKLKAGEKPKVCVNADCHVATVKVVDGKKMLDGKETYHVNCYKDCHKKQKKGPTKCAACHPGAAEEE